MQFVICSLGFDMLSFASICPHPPIIIPEIGGTEIKKCQKTISAMKKLTDSFSQTKPETIIVITPHGSIDPNQMTILGSQVLSGDFRQFGHPEISQKFKNNQTLIEQIRNTALADNLPVRILQASELDHGVLVPLYYLCQNIIKLPKLIVIAYSLLNTKIHFAFGKIIGQVINRSDKKIAVIASGDLSHRLTPDAPAGYSPRGQKFDQKLMTLLKNNNIYGILNLDNNLVDAAGECGLRSIIILLGVLSHFSYQPQILSYEGPFGVGYGVVNFNLN